MTRIGALLWAKGRIARNQIASVRGESKLKIAVVSISAILLWAGAFWAFWKAFNWLADFESSLNLGNLVMNRLLSVFALALFFMLVFSNVLIAFSTLYRSSEVAYLVQAPLPWWEFYLGRLVECVAFSSWASAYLGSPLILAYGLVVKAPLVFYAAAVASYLPYVTIPAAIGSGIAMLLVRVFPSLPRGSMIGAGALSVAFLFIYLRDRLNSVKLSESVVLDAMSRTQSWFLPSHWASAGVLAAGRGEYADAAFWLLMLVSTAMMFVLCGALLAHLLFYPGWSSLMGHHMSRRAPGSGLLGRIDGLLTPLREPHRALVVKDVKLFWREPSQWSQFVIFFGIMALYVASLKDRASAFETPLYRNWMVCLNIAACTLILATLTSRFIFPLISLEGRRFWVLGLAPVTFRQIMWQKFWLSVCTTSAFTISLVALTCYMLEVGTVTFALALYSIVVTNFGLAGLAVGLGALYPNFQEDNPARIVSGMGGTLNFLLSMAYIVLIVGAQAIILFWGGIQDAGHTPRFWTALGLVFAFMTVLSAAVTLLPMRLGLRNLNESEY